VLRNIDVGGQGRTAKSSQVESDDAVFFGSQMLGDPGCRSQFNCMPLPVIEGQAVAFIALMARDGEASG
jgi:hypothetical protein